MWVPDTRTLPVPGSVEAAAARSTYQLKTSPRILGQLTR
jgi:hypothetical protein